MNYAKKHVLFFNILVNIKKNKVGKVARKLSATSLFFFVSFVAKKHFQKIYLSSL